MKVVWARGKGRDEKGTGEVKGEMREGLGKMKGKMRKGTCL